MTVAASFLFLSLLASPPPAGEWRLDAQNTKVKVLSWGLFCGKEPRDSRGLPGAHFALTRTGEDFELRGAGRHFGSSTCGMDPPTFKPRVRDRSGDTYSVTCEGPAIAGQPQSSEHKFAVADDGAITYVTRGEVRKSEGLDACRYAYETTMKFGLASEAGPCAAPGKAARLVLSPASKDAELGERICFTVAAMDTNGCVVNAGKPTVSAEPAGVVEVDGSGCVWTPKDIKETTLVAVTVSADEARGSAVVRVIKPGGQQETIEQTVERTQNVTVKKLVGEVMTGELVVKAPNEVGSEAPAQAMVMVVAAEPPLVPPWLMLSAGAGLVLMMAAFGLWLRTRKQKVMVPVVVATVPPPPPGQGWKCPTCKFEYGAAGKCPHDGAELVINEVQGRATMFIPQVGGMICPTCGTKYPRKARFCGNDRTPLVPDVGQLDGTRGNGAS